MTQVDNTLDKTAKKNMTGIATALKEHIEIVQEARECHKQGYTITVDEFMMNPDTLDKKIEEILSEEIEHEMGSNGNAVKRLSLLLQQTCREVREEDLNILRQERNRLLAEREVDKRNDYPPRPAVEARLLGVIELIKKIDDLATLVKEGE
jgi:hypothetical protein